MILSWKKICWRKKKACQGAMLLEVLLALVILSVSLTVVIRSLIVSQQMVLKIENLSLAIMNVDNLFFELTLLPDEQRFSEIVDSAENERFVFDLKKTKWTGEENANLLNLFELKVLDKMSQKADVISMSFFLLGKD